jgi:hypothetical protein
MKTIASILLLLTAPALSAQTDTAPDVWRRMAAVDADEALRLIVENHPGAAESLGDTVFQRLLQTARAHVHERLPRVNSYEAYSAVMAGLATDLRDGHIWSNAVLQKTQRTWAGILIVRQGGQWVVGHHEATATEPDLRGARLVACDAVDAEQWARHRIGLFRGDPAVEAQLAGAGPWLLLDDANPFLPRPAACTFASGDETPRELRLSWRSISQRALETAAAASYQVPRAGMGVQTFEGGHWIALETLGSSAAEVVAEVERRTDELRASPMVVLDLRGNGGGNSAYANAIARALVGAEAMASMQTTVGPCSGAFWRASRANLEAMVAFRGRLEHRGETSALAQFDEFIRGFERDIAAGEAFSPALPECARTAPPPTLPQPLSRPPTLAGRLIIVTDRHCFSSCLIAVALFRQLGATQVGEATDLSTRYMEVREITLPSGLRTFSTLQKVALGLGDFGPYEPHVLYPGALADTDALRAFVARLR